MRNQRLFAVCLVAICAFALFVVPSSAQTPGPTPERAPDASDIVTPSGLPALGKWMFDPDLTPAHWLGAIYNGKALHEPINVLIVDPHASSVEDAKKRLLAACEEADYESRFGHSSGYQGYIDGAFYPQLPEEEDYALSNEPFEFDNNHGRVFGPALIDGKYFFAAAFSREDVSLFHWPHHQYESFNMARDDFAGKMSLLTDYRLARFVNLENAVVGDPTTATGDHDGIAVLLEAAK